jgi:hypothetical protein
MACRRVRLAAAWFALVLGGAQAAPLPLVQPSARQAPANLLRISLRFAEPPESAVLPRLALLHADGSAIAAPFLPQELWSPDGTVLTLLLHPGRVKTGLQAREELGPILAPGDTVTLTLDGQPLRRWQIGADDTEGPAVAAWRLGPVHAGTRQALEVALDAPIDARAAAYIAVADGRGRRVPGRAVLGEGEAHWTFIPAHSWRPGPYRLVVRATLEDAAGNRVGGSFEAPPGGAAAELRDVERAFAVAVRPAAPGR